LNQQISLSPPAESDPGSAAPLGHDEAESSSLSRPWLTAAEREDFTHRSAGKGLAIFAIEYAAVIVFAALAVAQLPIFLNIAAGLLDGYLVGALFIVGHDAAHQSLTPYRRLNTWIARLAMLPASYNSALWVHSHNRIHHRYTNLLGSDYVWAPMTPDAYRRAGPFRRFVYRLYRARLGAIPYTIIVMWWQKNFLPLAPEYRPKLRSYMFDTVFVVTGWLGYGAFIGWMGAALAPDRPLWLTLLLGWIFPWVTWNWAFGWTTFLHHTHPEVPWFSGRAEWSRHRVQVLGTIHVDVPLALDIISNRIMDHNAHHACPAIPLYNLRRAQRHLLAVFHEVHRIYLTPAKYAATANACKLYDPSQRRWTDFAGRPTGPTLG
jgi:omega-6 fatty acid desaturase (delta-12 desaturase)